MKKLLYLLPLVCISQLLFAQELVNYQIGKGFISNIAFQKIDSFYYQIGVFNEETSLGFNDEAQVISEIGNNIDNQIYAVKYDLDFNIVWATAIEFTSFATKLQMKFENDFLYIFYAKNAVGGISHRCHRINVNDPDDAFQILSFETGASNASYTFEIDGGAIIVAGIYYDNIKFDFIGQPEIEYFCNSEQNIFLARYGFIDYGASFSHIVQREWGNPGNNKRVLDALQIDDDGNVHLFGYGEGSAQLDGNLGEAFGSSATFQLSYSNANELIRFEETDIFFWFPTMIVPTNDDTYVMVGGKEQATLDENMEIQFMSNVEYNTNQRLVDVAVNDDSYTALYEFRQTIFPLSFWDFTFQTRDLDYGITNHSFDGTLNWYAYFGGENGADIPISIDHLENGNLLLCGNTYGSLDLDPTSNVEKYDYQVDRFFAAEYSMTCNGLSTGLTNISQINCSEDAKLEFAVRGGSPPFAFYFNDAQVSDYNNVEVAVPGVYEAYVMDAENCSKTVLVPIDGPSDDPDAKLNLHHHAADFRTGFETEIYYTLINENCVARSGKIRIVLDDEITFENASLVPSLMEGQMIEFDYANLIYQDEVFELVLDLKISKDAVFGSELCARVFVFDDQGNEIDQDIICKEVINSFDPNDISVAPYGRCEENYFLGQEALEYTIRFQNLGNAEAINIEVRDTLSGVLDVMSFMQTGSSHDAIVHFEEDSILIINYFEIYLPAEEQDEAASNGFFSYKINTQSNADLNSEIDNRAAIYFDFNDPVITNTVRSTLIDELPLCVLTSVDDLESNILDYYPNPASETMTITLRESIKPKLQLFDIEGKHHDVKMEKSGNALVLFVDQLPKGMYFLKMDHEAIRFVKE